MKLRLRPLVALAPSLLLAPSLYADVLHVTVGNSIQAAVSAAADGDTILVDPGLYHSFTIQDKDLRIVSSVLGEHVVVAYEGSAVSNLAEGKEVVLGRIRFTSSSSDPLICTDCEGSIRLQECVFTAPLLAPGATLLRCADVSLVDCILRGGDGHWEVFEHGAPGLDAHDCNTAITDCRLQGGEGAAWDTGYPGYGGSALRLDGGFAFVSASTLIAGDGGAGSEGAVSVLGGAHVELLDNVLQGSAPPQLPGPARVLHGTVFEPDGTSTLRVTGHPGDRVTLFWSSTPDFRHVHSRRGILLCEPPVAVEDGGWILDATGKLEFTWQPPAVAQGDARATFLQALIESPSGKRRITNVVSTIVVPWP